MSIRLRIRHWLRRRHENLAGHHLLKAARYSTHDLHRCCHYIAAVDALTNIDCGHGECKLSDLPKRMADRMTNVLVPDSVPADWEIESNE